MQKPINKFITTGVCTFDAVNVRVTELRACFCWRNVKKAISIVHWELGLVYEWIRIERKWVNHITFDGLFRGKTTLQRAIQNIKIFAIETLIRN